VGGNFDGNFNSLTNLLPQMATLGVYEEMARKYLDKETIAQEIIPELWKLSLMSTLNALQFKKYMAAVKELSSKVEEQHLRQLEGFRGLEDSQPSADTSKNLYFISLFRLILTLLFLMHFRGCGSRPFPVSADRWKEVRCWTRAGKAPQGG